MRIPMRSSLHDQRTFGSKCSLTQQKLILGPEITARPKRLHFDWKELKMFLDFSQSMIAACRRYDDARDFSSWTNKNL